ncbi:hypothetical protein [Streptomyces sp. NPDC055099]
MHHHTGTPLQHARRSATAVAAAAVALSVLTGCGSGVDGTKERGHAGSSKRPADSASASAASGSGGAGGARAARLVDKAIDATLNEDYLRSTRRTKSEGTTVLHSAVRGDSTECKTHARKGARSLDFVVTSSALYTRGSREALMMAPEAKSDPVRVRVMADRWVKRNASVYEVMRDMCASKTRRTWLEKRIPSLESLATAKPARERGTLQGQPTIKLTYEREGGPLRFHIAAEGTPLLLRVTYPAKDLDESYSDFGSPFPVNAPRGSVTDHEMAEEVFAAQ